VNRIIRDPRMIARFAERGITPTGGAGQFRAYAKQVAAGARRQQWRFGVRGGAASLP
jgi:hypothetical protein